MARGEASHSSAPLPTGYEFHGFRIERVLGHGGYGITYLAWEQRQGRRVALKELFPRHVAVRVDATRVAPRSTAERGKFEQARRSFIAEAQQLARLHHDNLVRVHSLFEAHQTAYFVMDYIEGINFRQWIDAHRVPREQELINILVPLIDGLAYIHSRGILHQDISPENILVTPQGRPVLIDFGASRGAGFMRDPRQSDVTRAGYSAIELYSGAPRGPWTDVYAMAAVMVHALRGHVAPTAIDRRLAAATELPLAEHYRGRYRQAFLRALDRAFAVQPQDRPQSMPEFREMLAAQVTELRGFDVRFLWRRWKWALVVLLIFLIGAVALVFWPPKPVPPNPPPGPSGNGSGTVVASGSTTSSGNGSNPAPGSNETKPGLGAHVYRTSSGMNLLEIPALTTSDRRIFFGQTQVCGADFRAYQPGAPLYIPFADDIRAAGLTLQDAARYPVVHISQQQAVAFCQQMTAQETSQGLLPPGAFFRLPTSQEWSVVAGQGTGSVHPWGDAWPPRDSSGAPLANLADASLGRVPSLQQLYSPIDGYDDGYPTTAPVGSFPALRTGDGLLDLGSNVEEWCADRDGSTVYARGASWRDADGTAAVTSRMDKADCNAAYDWVGFRVVLEIPSGR